MAVAPGFMSALSETRLSVFSRRGSYDTTVLRETYFHDDAFLHSFKTTVQKKMKWYDKGKV